jgi:PAS domain S-box-containing protein
MTKEKPAGPLDPQPQQNTLQNAFTALMYDHPVPMWVYDPVSRAFLDVNKAALDKYGYTLEAFLTMTVDDILAQDGSGAVEGSSGPSRTFAPVAETRHILANGSSIDVELTSHTIERDGSQAVFVIANDLSRRNREDVERRNAEQMVRDIQRMESIGMLSSGIAHDFNNLLGAMMGNVTIAQTRISADHPAVHNLEKALSAMERAADLTKQILAYSGKGRYEIRSFDLAKLLREHVSMVELSLQKHVRLVTHLPSIPVNIKGDPGQIEQVIMNMVINGSDAIEEGSGVVSITLTIMTMTDDDLLPYGLYTNSLLPAGTYALIQIADNGIGMSKETQKIIFDPFFTTKFIGRGLGLSAVLGIIRGHDGGITVESEIGAGTTFRVILPVDMSAIADVTRDTAGTGDMTVHEKTVLVIDDEFEIAAVAQEMLQTGNYTAIIEMDPRQGIEVYKQLRTDIWLVLLDMAMPEMSGKEVVDRLQEINPDVKIIISSGYSEDVLMKKIGASKVSGFIQKPFRLQSLLALVEKVQKEA